MSAPTTAAPFGRGTALRRRSRPFRLPFVRIGNEHVLSSLVPSGPRTGPLVERSRVVMKYGFDTDAIR